jgi:acyl carrier protein
MEMNATLSRVQSLVSSELDVPVERLDPGRPLDELGVDSLSVIEVMFRLEEVFHIRFPEERQPISTLADIADLVDRLVARKSAGVA